VAAENTIMFLKVKKNTTVANVLSLILITGISMMTTAYINAQVIFLLASPDYFNVPLD